MNEQDVKSYIDQHGMVHLLEMIVKIAHEKAEHVQVNWQDRTMASAWRRGAKRLEAAMRYWPL